VCNAHGPSAGGPKICHTLFFQVKLTVYINLEIHSLNAAAESPAMQYDTDILSAFPI